MTIPDPARYDLEARITAASEDIDRWHSGGAPTAEGQAYGVMRADALALLDYCQRYERLIAEIRSCITSEDLDAVMFDGDALAYIVEAIDGFSS